jgi:hypothetical protein
MLVLHGQRTDRPKAASQLWPALFLLFLAVVIQYVDRRNLRYAPLLKDG